MVRDPASGKYRRTRLFVLTPGYSRKTVGLLVHAVDRAGLGRTARAGVPAAGRHRPCRRALQPQGGCPHPGHLRPVAQSALPRRTGSLRDRGPAVPRRRPRSQGQGQGRGRRRPREEDAAARSPFRTSRRRPDVSGLLGATLGRHAHPRHNQAPDRRHVLPRNVRRSDRCPLEPFRYYQYGTEPCISTASSRSRRPTKLSRSPGKLRKSLPPQGQRLLSQELRESSLISPWKKAVR